MTRKLPDDDTIIEWHLSGITFQQMADQWNPELIARGEDPVTSAAFNMKCFRLGLPARNQRHDDLVPWTPIRPEHNGDYKVNMLRRESARRAGVPRFDPTHPNCDEKDLQRLNSWIQGLAEGNNGKGVVVHYDPDTLKGWHYVNRRKSDKDIIRVPRSAGRKTVTTQVVKPTARERRVGG